VTKYLLALALLLPGAAEAACPLGGSPLYLEIPAIGNSADWAPCIRRDLLKLSTSTVLNFKADFQSTSTTPTHKFVRFLSSSGFELGSINSAGTLAWAYGFTATTATVPTLLGNVTVTSSFTANGDIQGRADIIADDDLKAFDDLQVSGTGHFEEKLAVGDVKASIPSTATLFVQGNLSVTDTAQMGTLKFNDGTSMNTAPSGAASVVMASHTFTINGAAGADNRSLGLCFTPSGGTSSATITASGTYPVQVDAKVVWGEGISSQMAWMAIQCNGSYAGSGFSAATGCDRRRFTNATDSLSCSVVFPIPAPGAYSCCIAVASDTNTLAGGSDTKAKSSIVVKEVH
jgi:hypothetical protein